DAADGHSSLRALPEPGHGRCAPAARSRRRRGRLARDPRRPGPPGGHPRPRQHARRALRIPVGRAWREWSPARRRPLLHPPEHRRAADPDHTPGPGALTIPRKGVPVIPHRRSSRALWRTGGLAALVAVALATQAPPAHAIRVVTWNLLQYPQ